MKKLTATFALLATSWPCFGQLADMIELPEEMNAEPTFTDEQLLRSWGWLLADRFNLGQLELSRQEIDWISEGLKANVSGDAAPTNLDESQYAIQEYFAEREIEIRDRQLQRNRRKEQEFFDALMGLPDVQSLATGLYYQVLEQGSENKPKRTDTVVVRYEGRFLDNSIFDTTEGRRPAVFKLNEVIDGWSQGIPLIGEGGRIKLYVPSKLGYGEEGRPSIPPASTLVFEVELLKIGVPEAENAEPALQPDAVDGLGEGAPSGDEAAQ